MPTYTFEVVQIVATKRWKDAETGKPRQKTAKPLKRGSKSWLNSLLTVTSGWLNQRVSNELPPISKGNQVTFSNSG